MKMSLGPGGALDALIGNLEGIGLRIRAGDGEMEREDSAAGMTGGVTLRAEMNRRGMVFAGELREGEASKSG